jgi:hypothetical protein
MILWAGGYLLWSLKKWSKRNPLNGKHKQQQKKKPKKVFIYIMICIGLTGCFNDGPINEKIHYGIVMITAAQNFARLSVYKEEIHTHTHPVRGEKGGGVCVCLGFPKAAAAACRVDTHWG